MSNGPRAALARPAAIVTSATVDVQVLRIGAKQMTLAVFRQLHRDDAMDGPMWGTVNYCHRLFDWPCNPKTPESHQHIVWQDGNELRHGLRQTLENVLSARSQYIFGLMKTHNIPGAEQQQFIDHAGTFTPGELRFLAKALDERHRYSPLRWREAFLNQSPGRWQEHYAELERKEAPFLTLPQLFIAV